MMTTTYMCAKCDEVFIHPTKDVRCPHCRNPYLIQVDMCHRCMKWTHVREMKQGYCLKCHKFLFGGNDSNG